MQHHLVIVCILNKSTRHTYNTQSVWEGKIERNQENIINTKNKVRSAMPPEDVAEKTKQKRKNDYHHIHTDINAVKQGTKRNNRLTEAHSKNEKHAPFRQPQETVVHATLRVYLLLLGLVRYPSCRLLPAFDKQVSRTEKKCVRRFTTNKTCSSSTQTTRLVYFNGK